jgi:hypothetical protein
MLLTGLRAMLLLTIVWIWVAGGTELTLGGRPVSIRSREGELIGAPIVTVLDDPTDARCGRARTTARAC